MNYHYSRTQRFLKPKAAELTKELQSLLVKAIDYSLEMADEALGVLASLKELKFKKPISLNFDDDSCLEVPQEFRCPISKELMNDPVILATGQTYDRPFIQRWFSDGHRTCPQTQQVMSHTILIPNHLVRGIISQWCKERGPERPKLPQDIEEEIIIDAHRYLNSLLEKMSSSLSDQKEAAKELCLITKRMSLFRAFFGESIDAIRRLLYPVRLPLDRANTDPDLLKDLITTVLNLSIHRNNKKVLAEYPLVIPMLMESLKSRTVETRKNAAATLFSLSSLDSNKLIIGQFGALQPLIDLLEDGHPLTIKDVASAIFNLCIVVENKGRAVHEGAIRVILKKIMDGVLVDELLAVLALLCSHQKAVEEMEVLGAVPCLLSIIREGTSERNKKNCVAILHIIREGPNGGNY